MDSITIYHNPRCSKSRQALALLEERGINPTVVDYIKNPLKQSELEELATHFELSDFVRSNETLFKELGLSLTDEKAVIKAMASNPKLMQRPIVVKGNKAVIGRPLENVLELI